MVILRAGILRFAHGPARKKSHRGKKKVKKNFTLRAKNKKKHQKSPNYPQKTTKTQKNTKKTPKKKFRADARKISPNAKKKSQFPWPRRGHQTGKIPALGLGGASGFNYFDYFDLENWWAARAASRANSTTAEPAKAVKNHGAILCPWHCFFAGAVFLCFVLFSERRFRCIAGARRARSLSAWQKLRRCPG